MHLLGPPCVRARLGAALAPYLREDPLVVRIVLAYALTQLATIAWDLPCMYGWENDGIAPRDLFGGLSFNLSWGNGYRYPFFHYALLALLVWPVLVFAVLQARSLRMPDLMQSVLSVPVLTGIALLAKLLSVAMSCLLLLVLARLARRSLSSEAGRWAAGFGALNLSLAYYGRVSNLDGPYLMWVALSLDRLFDVAERGEARDYRGFAICAAAAIATKDQAYSVYALTLPLYALWVRRPELQAKLRAAGVFALSYAVFSAALVNPSGFVHRVRLLAGANSRDWRGYSISLAGVGANLADIAHGQATFFWPWPVIVLAWVGVVVVIRTPSGVAPQRLGLRLLPLACAVSSLLTFTLVVGRSEARFVLPLGFALSYYAAAAAAVASKRVPTSAAVLLLLWAALPSLALHLTQWCDARRDVEAYLARLPQGSRVETYGLGVYLPRFDRTDASVYRVQRVAPDSAPNRRPVIPGIVEVRDAYGRVAERAPDVLVIPEAFATRFFPDQARASVGRSPAPVVRAFQGDHDAQAFFAAALSDKLAGYRVRMIAQVELPLWAAALGITPVRIHGSTAQRIFILERVGS